MFYDKVTRPTAKHAWIVTFYAFKGGTGRTLALTNVARYLSEERGYRVGLVDLDLESPGLPHEPLSSSLDFESPERGNLQAKIDESKGFLDLFNELSFHFTKNTNTTKNDPLDRDIADKTARAYINRTSRLSDYVFPVESNDDGSIFLMPAAKCSYTKGRHFKKTLSDFMTYISYPKLKPLLPSISEVIFNEFIQEYCLDFLLVDGRTGLGSFSPIYTVNLPHALVLFMGLNEQNTSGCLDVIEAANRRKSDSKAPVFLVASPVPTAGPQSLEERLGNLNSSIKRLHNKIKKYENCGEKYYVFDLPPRISFTLPYNDLASFREQYFIGRFPHCQLSKGYIDIAKGIESLIQAGDKKTSDSSDSCTEQLRNCLLKLRRPLKIDLENVNLELFESFLNDVGLQKNGENSTGRFKETIVKFGYSSETTLVEINYWSATDVNAPWMKLRDGELVDSDIVALSQSFVNAISDIDNSLIDLYSSRKREDLEYFNFSYLDFASLDKYYPGWRAYCIADRKIIGLPFSINTPILFTNVELLKVVSKHYWFNKGDTVNIRNDYFVPSSWDLIYELVTLSQTEKFSTFLFSSDERALYYEWLNVVLAYGGKDIEIKEGGIFENANLNDPKTIEGTLVFLHIMKELMGKSNRRPQYQTLNTTMDELIKMFSNGDLAMYMGWTDSVLFEWDENNERVTNIRPIHLPSSHLSSKFLSTKNKVNLRIGRFLRDIRFPRKPLVDGWVITFPRNRNTDAKRHNASLSLANCFISPDFQRRLLKKGFPTRSLSVVEEEILEQANEPISYSESINGFQNNILSQDQSKRIREEGCHHSYRIFLDTLSMATRAGHAVPSHEKTKEVISTIRSGIANMINLFNSNEIEITQEFSKLNKKIEDLLRLNRNDH